MQRHLDNRHFLQTLHLMDQNIHRSEQAIAQAAKSWKFKRSGNLNSICSSGQMEQPLDQRIHTMTSVGNEEPPRRSRLVCGATSTTTGANAEQSRCHSSTSSVLPALSAWPRGLERQTGSVTMMAESQNSAHCHHVTDTRFFETP